MNSLSRTAWMVAFGTLCAAPGAWAKDPPPVEDRQAQNRTVDDLHAVGRAMTAWLDDQSGDRPASPCADRPSPDPAVPPSYAGELVRRNEAGERAIFGAPCPLATHAEVAAILVPKYLAALPEKDGWGHPYQFVLDRTLSAIGVRSPGRDGKFESDTYTAATFLPPQFDRDIVWWQGLFVRWPQS